MSVVLARARKSIIIIPKRNCSGLFHILSLQQKTKQVVRVEISLEMAENAYGVSR